MMTGSAHHSTHAAERAAERYGIEASAAEWRALVLDIIDTVAGDRTAATLVRKGEDGKELWLARLAGRPVIALYAPDSAVVVSLFKARPDPSGRRCRGGFGRARQERERAEVWE